MSVSIVIPHYGDASPTLALIHQLLPQVADDDQIIVSDDASPQPFPDCDGVHVVRRANNGGFSSAVNSGAAAASGDLLLILNSDLDVGPDFLAQLVAQAQPWQPCIAGPRMESHDGVADTARRFPTAAHQVVEWLTPLARWRDSAAWRAAVGHDTRATSAFGPVLTDWLVGAALLLPLSAFRAVGGFDERFHMNSEEVDLQRRLRDAGVPAVYLPGVVIKHEGGGSSDPGRRRRWVVEARWAYARKWGGVWPLRAGLTAATGVNLVVNTARAAAGRPTHPVTTAREELDLIWERGRS